VSTVEAHPYADAWPMLREDELAELAADIAATGLRHSIVLHDGMVLDGRNRLAACTIAGVEPTFVGFEGTDDDALAFVQSENNARRHQSKGSLAASWALSMLAAGRRADGTWDFRKRKDLDAFNRTWRQQLGVIADHAPHLLIAVRDDTMSLNAAYAEAERARDAERQALADQERIAAEETDARTRLEDIAPEYLTKYETARQALAAWEDHNREAAARARRERAEQERRAQAQRQNAEQEVRSVAAALANLSGLQYPEARARTQAAFAKYSDAAPPTDRAMHDPHRIRDLAGWLNTYADEMER
jgi:hypothetical protein